MADNKDEIEVEIDLPEKETPETQIEVGDERPASNTDDVLADLKRQLDAERELRMRAEQTANQGASEANRALEEKRKSEMQLLSTAIETVGREQDMLKSQYAQALSNGDHSSAADIQAAMAENAAKLTQMKMGKDAMESAPIPKFQPVQHTPTDPVEALASQLSPRSAEWVRKHPEYARNPNLYQKMVAAHKLVEADGILADTDEYFSTIEGLLKITPKAPEPESAMSQASQAVSRRSAPPAAPVSRSGNGVGDSNRVGRLTREEVEIAEMMGMTKEEYYKHKQQLKKEGRMN